MGKKRFGVLLCAEDSEYVKKKYGGYFGVFVRMLGEEDEVWDVFSVSGGEFPENDDLQRYDGFVITGSCSDAHGNEAWICKLCSLVQTLVSLRIKILGICFGHQILCRALGGKTGRAGGGWDIGVTELNFSPSKLLTTFQIPSQLSVIECHRDEVRELPPLAKAIAWSKKTGVEMFIRGDHILGIQGHPEYTKDIGLHLVDRLLHQKLIEASFADAAKSNLEAHEPSNEAWKRLCRGFLKGTR